MRITIKQSVIRLGMVFLMLAGSQQSFASGLIDSPDIKNNGYHRYLKIVNTLGGGFSLIAYNESVCTDYKCQPRVTEINHQDFGGLLGELREQFVQVFGMDPEDLGNEIEEAKGDKAVIEEIKQKKEALLKDAGFEQFFGMSDTEIDTIGKRLKDIEFSFIREVIKPRSYLARRPARFGVRMVDKTHFKQALPKAHITFTYKHRNESYTGLDKQEDTEDFATVLRRITNTADHRVDDPNPSYSRANRHL